MKNTKWESCLTDAFFGSATVGERGQIVIPAEARAELDIQPGTKVLIMRHPVHQGLQIFKIEAVREFLDAFQESLHEIENRPSDSSHEHPTQEPTKQEPKETEE
ncbi:MAG: AbrB/MazE/SpoVT family DNA-binding domain-containing protein [Fimbriimonas sp.]